MHPVKQAIIDAHVFEEGHFIFADGAHALVKLEMDHLWQHQRQLDLILDLLAEASVPKPDLILGVPTGGQRLAEALITTGRLAIPMAYLERIPGGTKQDFRFKRTDDAEKVRRASIIMIYEDVVSTLSSVAGVVKLLNPDQQEIHSHAIWRRGEVKKHYSKGVSDYYLYEEKITSFLPEECPYCQTSGTTLVKGC